MLQNALAAVPDTKEQLKLQLKHEWEAIAQKERTDKVDVDVQRAQVLSQYLNKDLTQKDMANELAINLGHIDRLLRYGRFVNGLHPMGCKIPERRFRQYWYETADKASLCQLRGKKQAEARLQYEQQIFQRIAEKIRGGETPAPVKPHKAQKKPVNAMTPKEVKTLHAAVKDFQVLKRKEVQEAYQMIDEDVRALVALSHSTRSTYSPGQMASHATRLKKGYAALQRALKNKVDEWLQDVL